MSGQRGDVRSAPLHQPGQHHVEIILGAQPRTTGRIQRVSQKRSAPVTIQAAALDLPAAAEILRDYLGEMISRYYGRPADDAEISRHLGAGHGSDDLAEPTGVLLLAQSADGGARSRPVGCVGLRRLDEQTRELTRLFVRPEARGAGVGALLLAAAEQRARADGASVIRLNTRHDLIEARALYAGHGYEEIPRYGDDPLAEHWFEKKLRP